MKLKTLVHRKVRKVLYRLFRFNPYIEALCNSLRRTNTLSFHEVGLSVRVSGEDILIDCGANVGEITSRMAATVATIYAFEPDPYAFSALEKRFSLNRRVHPINKGVMDRQGSLEFYLFGSQKKDRIDSSVGSSFVADKNVKNSGGVVSIECVDFAEFVFGLDQTVKLVKMDIEGAEVQVLNHLIDTRAIDRIEHMIVETHEMQIPSLVEGMEALRRRISNEKLTHKIHLDWV